MATTQVTTVTHSCDMCGTESDKPLRGNAKLRLAFDVFALDGAAAAREDTEKDLCLDCVKRVRTFIAENTALAGSPA